MRRKESENSKMPPQRILTSQLETSPEHLCKSGANAEGEMHLHWVMIHLEEHPIERQSDLKGRPFNILPAPLLVQLASRPQLFFQGLQYLSVKNAAVGRKRLGEGLHFRNVLLQNLLMDTVVISPFR